MQHKLAARPRARRSASGIRRAPNQAAERGAKHRALRRRTRVVKVGAIVILPLLGDEAPAATQATETNEDGHDDEGTRSMNEDGYEYDDDEEGC